MRRNGGILFCIILLHAGFISDAPTPYRFPDLRRFPAMPIDPGNPVTVEGADLGKHLFYDPVLSIDSTMACASCHRQKSAFSDAPMQFSSGRNEVMKRNTMPLFNLAWYPSLFWDGRAASIEEQVFHPLRENNEMNLDWKMAARRLNESPAYKQKFLKAFGTTAVDSVQISKAIAQFLRTLISYRSKYDKVLAGELHFTPDEYKGFVLVNEQQKGDCLHCHNTDGDALGTQLQFSNNGLDAVSDPEKYIDKGRGKVTGSIRDNGKFMIPSLRNLAFTAPYMHDGRFQTLEEVIDFYSGQVQRSVNIDPKMEFVSRGGAGLSGEEKRQIVAFLLTLSDSAFISDPAFENPFFKK